MEFVVLLQLGKQFVHCHALLLARVNVALGPHLLAALVEQCLRDLAVRGLRRLLYELATIPVADVQVRRPRPGEDRPGAFDLAWFLHRHFPQRRSAGRSAVADPPGA